MNTILKLQGVCKTYEMGEVEVPALKNINIEKILCDKDLYYRNSITLQKSSKGELGFYSTDN
mgnify:CR=1 FL=1